MLEMIREELAMIEVLDELNMRVPKWEQSLFKRKKRKKFTEIELAIKHYEGLSDNQICICFWENAAWARFNGFMFESVRRLRKTISQTEFVKLESRNIDLLLKDGSNEMMVTDASNFELYVTPGNYAGLAFGDDELLVDEIPGEYKKLLSGEESEFLSVRELSEYKMLLEEKWASFGVQGDEIEEGYVATMKYIVTTPCFKDYFNKSWNLAMQIQALLWYKKFLDDVKDLGLEKTQWVKVNEIHQPQIVVSIIRQLERKNVGFLLMEKAYICYMDEHKCEPVWGELMDYIGCQEWNDWEVSVSRAGVHVSEIKVNGLVLTRDKFRKRFRRNFKG